MEQQGISFEIIISLISAHSEDFIDLRQSFHNYVQQGSSRTGQATPFLSIDPEEPIATARMHLAGLDPENVFEVRSSHINEQNETVVRYIAFHLRLI